MKIQHGGIIIKDKDPEKAFHSFTPFYISNADFSSYKNI
jgi:hypothetical protein